MLTITSEKGYPDIFHLSVYETVKIGTAVSDTGAKFSIYAGLDQSMAEQLKAYSLDKADTDIQQTTRDAKRFGEYGYERWYSKEYSEGRYPYVLIAEPEGTLAAIVWYGFKPYPMPERKDMVEKDCHTFSCRSYKPYRGTHLMSDFLKFTQATYLTQKPEVLWLETSLGETGLYKRIGFKETGEISPLGKTVMVLEQ